MRLALTSLLFAFACTEPTEYGDLRVSSGQSEPLAIGATREYTVTQYICEHPGARCGDGTPDEMTVEIHTGTSADLVAVDRSAGTFTVKGVANGRTWLQVTTLEGSRTQFSIEVARQ